VSLSSERHAERANFFPPRPRPNPREQRMISRFFIDRPIFASVLSIVSVLAGSVAAFTLPVAQYPDVTPPTVLVTAMYPGANAQTVRDTIAAPIEAQVSGVEGMMYMSSQCTNDGAYNLTVTFRLGTDSDMAQVLVQNRVSLALPVIPPLVQSEGINVRKMSPNTMMIVNLIPPGRRYDSTFLSNYATIYIKDELRRLPGIAGITYLGQRDYSLRVWLDPDKLAALKMSASDVVAAITQQNLQVAAGQIGQQPVPRGQQFQLTINALGRLTDPEQFGEIILKASPVNAPTPGTGGESGGQDQGGSNGAGGNARANTNGSSTATSQVTAIVRLRDVARLELGSQQYDQSCTLDGEPSVALSIFQLPGSNALETASGVYAKMNELRSRFPEGMDYRVV
jgi:multidrug efflux pump subunit AcrB